MPRIWTHAEVSEAQEHETHNTPIHYDENYDPIAREKQWRRFVFFENLRDFVLISAAGGGLVYLLLKVTGDLFKQHGTPFAVSLVVVIVLVIVFNRKR